MDYLYLLGCWKGMLNCSFENTVSLNLCWSFIIIIILFFFIFYL